MCGERLSSLRHGLYIPARFNVSDIVEGIGTTAVARASLSAPESLTRGHENTTSQVRVSGKEGDA